MYSVIDFSLYNNFETAILILDSRKRIVFKNLSFLKNFGNIKNLEKFGNYFSFDICMLDSDNLMEANPVSFALGYSNPPAMASLRFSY